MSDILALYALNVAQNIHTDFCRVIGRAKDEFGCSIISRAYIGYIRFTDDKHFGGAEIAQLEDSSSRI